MYDINKKRMFCDTAENLAVIIDATTGIYYGINSFGTNVFECLIRGCAPEAILRVLEGFQGVPENMGRQLQCFTGYLLEKEILVEGPPATDAVDIDAGLALADGFELKIDAYADVQELLLADPIHDVDEEIGWLPVLKAKAE